MLRVQILALASVLVGQSLVAQSTQPNLHAPELFAVIPGQADPLATTTGVVRGVAIQLNLMLLRQGRAGDIIRFGGFDGEAFDIRLRKREMINGFPGAFHWHTDLVGDQAGRCTLTLVGTALSAYLVPGDLRPSTLAIQPTHGMHYLRELLAPNNSCGTCAGGTCNSSQHSAIPAPSRGSLNLPGGIDNVACDDDPTKIKVLALYDVTTQLSIGNTINLQTLFLNSLAQASQVMRDSGINITFEATSVRLVAYRATKKLDTELIRLGDKTDGYMDEIHAYRIADQADLVTLAVAPNISQGSVLGIAYTPYLAGGFTAAAGFSVCRVTQLSNYVLTHELGHNFGCFHDPANTTNTPWKSYAYGYQHKFYSTLLDKRWVTTIMAYSPSCICTIKKARMFSTPTRSISTTRGNITIGDASHNNVRAILDSRQMVTNWGQEVTGLYEPPTITQQPLARNVCLGPQSNPVMMSVGVTNGATYVWSSRSPGGSWNVVNGQASADLTFSTVLASHLNKEYRCRIDGPCRGTAISVPARLGQGFCGTNIVLANSGATPSTLKVVGDVDGDDYNDFALTQPAGNGKLWIVSGKTLAVIETETGTQANQNFGRSIAPFRFASPGLPFQNAMYVGSPGFSVNQGSKDGMIQEGFLDANGTWVWRQVCNGTDFGLREIGRLVVTGDYLLDGDGKVDLVFTAGNYIVACTTHNGIKEIWRYGHTGRVDAMAVVGDTNGDGYDDIAIGIPTFNGNSGWIGIISGTNGKVLSGRTDPAGTPDLRVGHSIARIGDVDGDGLSDVAFGVPGIFSGRGGAFIANFNLQTIHYVLGDVPGEQLGYVVSSNGDANGDGLQDLLVATRPTSASTFGRAVLISSADGKEIRERTGTSSTFGTSVASGDLNGDGIADDIVTDSGIDTVHVYDSPTKANPPRVTTYGPTCLYRSKIARASTVADPRIDAKVTFRLASGPSGAISSLLFGVSRMSLPLDPYGAHGCSLLVQSFATESLTTDSTGNASFNVQMPNQASLVGALLQTQWLAIDSPANQLGVTFSNGSTLRLGGR